MMDGTRMRQSLGSASTASGSSSISDQSLETLQTKRRYKKLLFFGGFFFLGIKVLIFLQEVLKIRTP